MLNRQMGLAMLWWESERKFQLHWKIIPTGVTEPRANRLKYLGWIFWGSLDRLLWKLINVTVFARSQLFGHQYQQRCHHFLIEQSRLSPECGRSNLPSSELNEEANFLMPCVDR